MTDLFDMMGDGNEYQEQNYDAQNQNYQYYSQQPQSGNNLDQMWDQGQTKIQSFVISPEQQQRRDRLKELEEERRALARAREEDERTKKLEKQTLARQYLGEFTSTRAKEVEYRRQVNRQNQQLLLQARKDHNDYRNSWDKIASNIGLKDGEYPGKKEITKMKQAILNKKADLSRQ